MEITIKMKTIVRKPLMIKIIQLRLRNLDNKHLKAGGHISRNVVEIAITLTLPMAFRWNFFILKYCLFLQSLWTYKIRRIDRPEQRKILCIIWRILGMIIYQKYKGDIFFFFILTRERQAFLSPWSLYIPRPRIDQLRRFCWGKKTD